MKRYAIPAIIAIVVGGGASYAANETVTMNAIDAVGIGKEIGTLELSDTEGGLRITPHLAGLPPGDHGFHVHASPNCGPGNGPNGQPAWRLPGITTQPTSASTSGHRARVIRATKPRLT